MKVPAERVRDQILSIFAAWGMDPGLARTAADVMVETDLAGVDSHGVSMLMDYDESRRKGKLNLEARPKVIRDGPVTALIDVDAGLGHPAAVMAMTLALDKAQAMGVAARSRCATRTTSAPPAITPPWHRSAAPGARHQPDRVRRAREAQRADSARHGDFRSGQQQGQGVRPARQADPGGLGSRRWRRTAP